MKLLIVQFSPASPTSSLLGPNIHTSILFSDILMLLLSLLWVDIHKVFLRYCNFKCSNHFIWYSCRDTN